MYRHNAGHANVTKQAETPFEFILGAYFYL